MEFHCTTSHPLFLARLLLIFFFAINFPCLHQVDASGTETDRLALIKIKGSITKDPNGIFKSWNDSLPFCNWFGVGCSHRHQRVTSLVLNGQCLVGSISPYIGNLSFVRLINLQNNTLHGEIPQEVGNLFRLEYFLVNNNTLGGAIPVNLTRCSRTRIINVMKNNIVGKIPAELGSLLKLEKLYLGGNYLTGVIPASLGNLSLLTYFVAAKNDLVGNIPSDLGRLTRLEGIGLHVNGLSGIVPSSLLNVSSIRIFSITKNQLEGSIPDDIGHVLLNLQDFLISGNQFSGSIPSSFANASQLQQLGISHNNFVGEVPTNLGNLQSLQWLSLGYNNLGSKSTNDLMFLTSLQNCSYLEVLDFNYNNFGGSLPNSVANLTVQLTELFFSGNEITGIIPEALGNLINLILLGMDINHFIGGVPSSFGKLQNMQVLALRGNRLSGKIPSFIGNLTKLCLLDMSQNEFKESIPLSIKSCQNLYILDFSQNMLNGAIPPEVFNLPFLSVFLNLSQNAFTGGLPTEVGKLANINSLDISENNLSGEIPVSIGDCSSLEYLYMQGNSIQGNVPSSLSSLKGLQHLDLSRNNLTGEIPKVLQNLTFLQSLNLSFNHFEGEVPTGGVFRNANFISLTGNAKLCGGVLEFHLPRCPGSARRSFKTDAKKLKIITISVLLPSLLILAFLVVCFLRKSKKKNDSTTASISHLMNVSYSELHQATNGFSSDNLIGSGSFSSIYAGFLNQAERTVAIKVLNLQQQGASKSIMAECNALRNIRHRNLVKIITFCSSLDYKGNEFKALVMEFMAKGSLEKWLHPENDIQSRNLNLLQRLNIAIDVASALHYLHDLCESSILHCDLKPANVLLDNDMVAHVSDFGLARFLPIFENKTSTIGIKGTIGYTALEYGMGSIVLKEGDVYNYGILILEMFSGKKPTDEIFRDGLNLNEFSKAAMSQTFSIVDPRLLSVEAEASMEEQAGTSSNGHNMGQIGEEMQKSLLSIFEIGIICSAESPNERMSMGDVVRKLHVIKNSLIRVQMKRGRPSRRPIAGA